MASYDFPGVAHDTLPSNPSFLLFFIRRSPFNVLFDTCVVTIRTDGRMEMARQNDDGKVFWFLSLSFTMSVQISWPVTMSLFLSISPAPPSIAARPSNSTPPPTDPITVLATRSGGPRPNSTNSFGARVACPPASVVRRSRALVIVRLQ